MIGLGLSIPEIAVKSSVYTPVNSQTTAFFNRLSTQPSYARAQLYDTMIGSLVSSGVWAALDVLYIFAAENSSTALMNLKSSSYTPMLVSTPTFTVNKGYTGTASSCINTNYNPSTAGGLFTLNSAHISVWDLTSRSAAAVYVCGSHDGTTETIIAPHFTGPLTYCRVNDNRAGIVDTVSNGHFIANRTTSSLVTGYLNGTSIGTQTFVGASITNANMFVCAGSNSGVILNPSTDQIASFSAGVSLTGTQVTGLYNALHTYMQAVAGVA